MTVLKWLIIAIIALILYIATIYMISSLFDEFIKLKNRKKVANLIYGAFKKDNKLTLKQIDILSRDHNLTSQDLQILLRRQFSLCVENHDITGIAYFQQLYDTFEKEAPFEGLPADVRFHLERLRDSLPSDNSSLMEPLTSQLQDINAKNVRKNKLLWWLTIGSFFIGLMGVGIGVIPYLDILKGSPKEVRKIVKLNEKVPAQELSLSNEKAIEMAKYYHGVELRSVQ